MAMKRTIFMDEDDLKVVNKALGKAEYEWGQYPSSHRENLALVRSAIAFMGNVHLTERDYQSINADLKMVKSQVSQRKLITNGVGLSVVVFLASLVFITLGILPLTFMVGAICSALAVAGATFLLIKSKPTYALQHSLDHLELEHAKALQKELGM